MDALPHLFAVQSFSKDSAAAWGILWWGIVIFIIRTLELAAAGNSRVKRMSLRNVLFAAAAYIAPVYIGYLAGTPLVILLIATLAAELMDIGVYFTHAEWSIIGCLAFNAPILFSLSFLQYALFVSVTTAMQWYGYALAFLLIAGELASAFIDVYYTNELIDVLCRTQWNMRLYPSKNSASPAQLPMVSLHVPAHDEPPEMVIQTLQAILRLDYPSFEIILIDDNTQDSLKWRPVMDFCLQNTIKVFHLQQYPGYKAGALNFALTQTSPNAELIAIVDADYLVQPNWLKETAPLFLQNPEMAFLQTPQAFTYAPKDTYHHMNALAERYFFSVGMKSRAERNSIIFCGTMGLIRRRVLERIGGWAEWSVTEDAEASLRIFTKGYFGGYLDEVYGYGQLPATLADLKKQHYRWAYGSVQLTRSYISLLLFGRKLHNKNPKQGAVAGASARLTAKQRYDYLMHGMHWFHPFLQIALGLFLNCIIVARIFHIPLTVRPLIASALLAPILGTVIGAARVLWSSKLVMKISWKEAVGVLIGLFAVHWAVSRASFAGLYRRRLPFLRTPKNTSALSIGDALKMAAPETIFTAIAAGSIIVLLAQSISSETILLSLLLLWHILVISPAIVMALLNMRQIRNKQKEQENPAEIETIKIPAMAHRS